MTDTRHYLPTVKPADRAALAALYALFGKGHGQRCGACVFLHAHGNGACCCAQAQAGAGWRWTWLACGAWVRGAK